jgi:hypothetical protein
MTTTFLELQTRVQQFLELIVEDPLKWNCPATTAADWDNVPETNTQVTLYLLKH